MEQDAFSRCHPLVNFLYFVGAIGFGVVIQHPAYLLAGMLGAAAYYLLLKGRKGVKTILFLLPLALVITFINPLFNTLGQTQLFSLFGKPVTLEALYYGAATAGGFIIMMLWFGCYSAVLTSDKFTSLFGSLIPSLSLLLVMVLRLIPSLMRKAVQITGARRSIGKAADQGSTRQKLQGGMGVLSALTDWALEGSVVTADSMRSRGYGTAKRTNFQIYRMAPQDRVVLAMTAVLALAVILGGGKGATYIPALEMDPLTWGFGAYCLYLAIPTAIHLKEALTWHILRSKI